MLMYARAHMCGARAAFGNARETFRDPKRGRGRAGPQPRRSALPCGGALRGWAHRRAEAGHHVDQLFFAAVVVGERTHGNATICADVMLTFTHTPPGPQPGSLVQIFWHTGMSGVFV